MVTAAGLAFLHKDALASGKGDVILDIFPYRGWFRVAPSCIGDACNMIPHLFATRSPPPLLRKRESCGITVLHGEICTTVCLLDA